MTNLCITVHWLDDRYHGLLSRDGPPEWPPSPYRLFQALVAGVARRGELDSAIGKSLAWLQTLAAPTIIAPRSRTGQSITRFVPNNDGDKRPDRQDRLTAKPTTPTLMLDLPEVHYLWEVEADHSHDGRLVCQAVRWLTSLGWGVDMAYAAGRIVDQPDIQQLQGIRWYPKPNAWREDGLLRVPVFDKESNMNTLCDLRRAHQSAIDRIEQGKPLHTVDKPKIFDRVFYASSERPLGRPYEVFTLRDDNDKFFRYPHAKLIHIAGMVRHAAIAAMTTYPPQDPEIKDPAAWVESFVTGHRPEGVAEHKQFSYIPLPSIGHEHSDAMIRRVMIVAPIGHDGHLRHLADQLDGARLQPLDGSAVKVGPTLNRVVRDNVARWYVGTADTWATVTPVILSGHDDHKPAKTEKLIRKALEQSGVDQACEFTWSALPHYKNCLTAHKYDRRRGFVGYHRPGHLKEQTAIHVRLQFQRPVAGPLSIGAGRHCGLGVFCRFDC